MNRPIPLLTKPQHEELRRLAIAPQSTYGRGRARVQNALVRMKLAVIYSFEECRLTKDGKEIVDPTAQRTRDLLSLVCEEDLSAIEISTWSPRSREDACAWALREHLRASDNPVRRLPEPLPVKALRARSPRRPRSYEVET